MRTGVSVYRTVASRESTPGATKVQALDDRGGILEFIVVSLDILRSTYNTERMKLIVTLVLYALSASAQTHTNSRTMLEMTFPEFEAAAAKTDVMLLPIGAIEEHGPHLPLASDALGATAQLSDVQRYLRTRGAEAILGPPSNIGTTNEAGDWTRDG